MSTTESANKPTGGKPGRHAPKPKSERANTDSKPKTETAADKAKKLSEMFPEWHLEDLVSLLAENSNDVESVANKILTGVVLPFSSVTNKKEKKTISSAHATSASETHQVSHSNHPYSDGTRGVRGGRGGAVRGRGGLVADRGRAPRGSRGGSRTAAASVAPAAEAAKASEPAAAETLNSETPETWPSSDTAAVSSGWGDESAAAKSELSSAADSNSTTQTPAPSKSSAKMSWAQVVKPAPPPEPKPQAAPKPTVTENVRSASPGWNSAPVQPSVGAAWDTSAANSGEKVPGWDEQPKASQEQVPAPNTEKLWNSAPSAPEPQQTKASPGLTASQPAAAMWNDSSASTAWDGNNVSLSTANDDTNAPPGFAKSNRHAGPLKTGRKVDQDAPIIMGANTTGANKIGVQFGSLSLLGDEASEEESGVSKTHETSQKPQQNQPSAPPAAEQQIPKDPSIVSISQAAPIANGHQSMYSQSTHAHDTYPQPQPNTFGMYPGQQADAYNSYNSRDQASAFNAQQPQGYGAGQQQPQHAHPSHHHHNHHAHSQHAQPVAPSATDAYAGQYNQSYTDQAQQAQRSFYEQQGYSSAGPNFGARASVTSPVADEAVTKSTSPAGAAANQNQAQPAPAIHSLNGYGQPMQNYQYGYPYSYNPYVQAPFYQPPVNPSYGQPYSKPYQQHSMYQPNVPAQNKAPASAQAAPQASAANGYQYNGTSYGDFSDYNKYNSEQQHTGGYAKTSYEGKSGSAMTGSASSAAAAQPATNSAQGYQQNHAQQPQQGQQQPPQQTQPNFYRQPYPAYGSGYGSKPSVPSLSMNQQQQYYY